MNPFTANQAYFLTDSSEMGKLLREKDWSNTPVGQPEEWPQSLRTAINLILGINIPMYLAWGRDYTQFYNDAFRSILGPGKHPAIGLSTRRSFAEIWDVIDPLFNKIMNGEMAGPNEFLLPVERNGYTEECHFIFSYSPLLKENGEIGGVLVTVTETTEKIISEKKLQTLKELVNKVSDVKSKISESAETLRLAIEAAELGTWDYNPATKELKWSDKYKELFGLPPDAAVNNDVFAQGLHPDDRDSVISSAAETFQKGGTGNYDQEYRTIGITDGKLRWLKAKGKAFFNGNGEAYRFIGIVLDITEEKLSQQALFESEERFRQLADSMPQMIFTADADGYTNYYNNQWYQLTGSPVVYGDDGYIPYLHPDDRQRCLDTWYEAVRRGTIYEIEYRIHVLHPTPGYRWFLVRATPVRNMEGKITKWFGTCTDIQDQKVAEEKLREAEQRSRLAIEAADLGSYTIDMRTGEVHHSDRFVEMFGFRLTDKIVHQDLINTIHPDFVEVRRKAHEKAMETGRLGYEALFVGPDNKSRWIRLRGNMIFDETGQPVKLMGAVMDITEQRTALNNLQASETMFRRMSDMAPVMIWKTRADGYCTYLNRQWYEFTGQSKEAALGWGWIDATHPNDKAHAEAIFVEAVKKRVAFRMEFRLRRHDGVYRWTVDSGTPRFNEDGEFEGHIGSVTDVHEQKMASEALEQHVQARTKELEAINNTLKKQKDFVETVLNSAVDIIAVFDHESRFISVNRQCETRYQKTASELIGEKMTDVFPGIESSEMYRDLQKALKGQHVHNPVYQSKILNSYFELYFIPLRDEDGEVYGVLTIAHDNTASMKAAENIQRINMMLQNKNVELQQSEERYYKMIDEVQDYAILMIDTEGNVVKWNKGAEKIKGYSEKEIVGKNFRIFYSKEDQLDQLPERLLDEATRRGRATHEGWRIRKDGTPFWANVVITALHNGNNEIIGFSKLTRDLTERKLSEDKMIKYTSELERSNNELEQFAYIASHDLQEPLRKIKTFAGRLQEAGKTNLDPQTVGYLDKITSASTRMSELINDLLEYSRTTKQTDEFKATDLNEVLKNVLSDYEVRINQKQALIRSNGLPTIEAVPHQMTQLFNNLLGNSLKFTKEGVQPVIDITVQDVDRQTKATHKLELNRHYYEIILRDNGIGFNQEFSDLIFEIFRRLNPRHEYSGSGIGLSTCRKIVVNHKGIIFAEGKENEGSAFHILLPAVQSGMGK